MRKHEKNPLPSFEDYIVPEPLGLPEDGVAADQTPLAATGEAPRHISDERLLDWVIERELSARKKEDEKARQIYERVLFQPALTPHATNPRLGLGQRQPVSRAEIEARYRQVGRRVPALELTAGPAHDSRRGPAAAGGENTAAVRKSDKRKVTAGDFIANPPKGETGKSQKLSEWLKSPKGRVIMSAGATVVALVGIGVAQNNGSGETAAALQAQPVQAELLNDTFDCPTPLAKAKYSTLRDVEIHIPVELSDTKIKGAYINVPVKAVPTENIAINACGTQLKGTGRSTWARLAKDKHSYVVDRSALDLSVDPWLVLNKGETQATSRAAKALLPPASGLNLYVDGQAVDPKKYPLSANGKKQITALIDGTNPKAPQFNEQFINTFFAKMEVEVVKTLEDPSKCSEIEPAIDTANKANLAQQKNIGKTAVTFKDKSEYGKASEAFANREDIKKYVASNAITIANFNISCNAEPVMPLAAKQPSNSPTTAPAAKKTGAK
jgi:hypothetical protein